MNFVKLLQDKRQSLKKKYWMKPEGTWKIKEIKILVQNLLFLQQMFVYPIVKVTLNFFYLACLCFPSLHHHKELLVMLETTSFIDV